MTTAVPTSVSVHDIAAVLEPDHHDRRPSALSASLTYAWRSLLKIKHLPEQLFNMAVLPVLLTLIFAVLFGGAIAGSTGRYLQFFLPGVLVQVVMLITIYTGSGLTVDVATGFFDRVRTLPAWQPAALVGSLIGDAFRYGFAATVVVAVGILLGFRPEGGLLGVLAAIALLLLFAFSVSWIWSVLGLMVKTERALHGLSMLVLFPLTFISNIFVDPITMPAWLQRIVEINPISHLVVAVRGLMAGTVIPGEIGWVLVASTTLVAVFAPLTMRMYRNKH
jgi:ABC-2 type transport system permease protein